MATLASMHGRGTCRIPTANGSSLVLRPHEQERVLRQVADRYYPHLPYGRALARLQSDPQTAQYVREAATAYVATR